jgi:hypothetical protein
MNEPKTALTWEEWTKIREARRSTSERVRPGIIRRQASSSDKRLRPTFNGERGPVLK